MSDDLEKRLRGLSRGEHSDHTIGEEAADDGCIRNTDFSRRVLEQISVEEETFAVEPELIAKLAKMQVTDPGMSNPRALRVCLLKFETVMHIYDARPLGDQLLNLRVQRGVSHHQSPAM